MLTSVGFALFTPLCYYLSAMPITKSAKKAQRQTRSRTEKNRKIKKEMRDVVRDFEKLVEGGKKDEAVKILSSAYKKLDKAAQKNVISKNTAARKKSRLFKSLKKK